MRVGEVGVAVRVENVVKAFRQGEALVSALRGVSLEIRAADFVAIMGPSGSGKSTLLHLLAGLDSPDSGSVVVAGKTIAAMNDDERTILRRRHVGIVFQSFNLIPTLTAEENVALPLRLDGVAPRAVRERVARALAEVGLEHRRHHRPQQLSGGEAQRVAIARALVIEPLLVLGDEPTGSLDTKTSADILALLRQAASSAGTTVVIVTHDANSAAYARRVVRLVDGVVESKVAMRLDATEAV